MSRRVLGLLLAAALVNGCGGGETVEGPPPQAPESVRLVSPAFADGAEIPAQHTCDGDEVAPALNWSGVPDGARELVLVMEDPDAPGGTFVHWTVFGLPPADGGLPRAGRLPAGAAEGENSFGDSGFGGPCPPEGDEPHRYVFLLYALPTESGLEEGAAPDEVREAVEAAGPLARGRLEGRYGR